jgi:hypothetical protein
MEMKKEGGSQEYEEFLNNIDRCYEEALGTLRNPLPPTEFEGTDGTSSVPSF